MSSFSTPCFKFSTTADSPDSHGRTVDFRNTVVIMTSNIGSELLMQGVTAEGEIKEEAWRLVLDALRNQFRRSS